MGFIDELTIQAKAGKGGDGAVRWRRVKYNAMGGPSGGDGGRGGDVYARAVRDVHLLSKYRHNPHFEAEVGGGGEKDDLHGANGEDFYINVPIGSILTNKDSGETFSLIKDGQEMLLLRGGKGGRGNASYKSSTNRSPEESTPGVSGEEAEFLIEIQLVADVGLIGLPSAGKTSLLNTLTNAQGKIGDYPFTTLEPNLGEFYKYILADIPGLIEGASEGKGLGHKFLRHVKRTEILVHLVSLENENPLEIYEMVRKEIEKYDSSLSKKPEIIVLTKTDVVDKEAVMKWKKVFDDLGKPVSVLSLYDEELIKQFQDNLIMYLRHEKAFT